ncbi:5-dehydro-4-deoxy-D-glucuronate isomerase [Actinoalloteichus hymeniacidonis]|uniref:4-deoxy-L-threo-5-hexosulose-uronate ketol-isomerase n=1 Tax=Actinoalloteichus hymeniacidonis TaxID=340345 RepID=A0AAC9HSX2_9PSEU|nr:5-dehydro-4-deoxy-D-glucuronate isomerase [Actinoalloteichus hymeniacidonis]AOS64341.1 4-deoxy-L-threo-5-hexulose uronate isomerase [Actinoalloteichus hymeniacidonis]MBB5907591.1 4-deoxy-L-threo-5-hexosulose-uronate ketol-isomerase [Actinoalloteichus hymeniacidonis]
MDVRYATNPDDARSYGTEELRDRYLVTDLFVPGEVRLTYSHQDRVILGGAMPIADLPLSLPVDDAVRTEYFCQRRELAVFCVDGAAAVTVDGVEYVLTGRDLLYIGRGSEQVSFAARDGLRAPKLYLCSAPAHQTHPTVLVRADQVQPINLGTEKGANRRRLHRYIDGTLVTSCQLMMGFTEILPGSVWNTMPCHTHARRTECYLYFDLAESARVVHLMGRPEETRHLIVGNEQAVISPAWSVHSGVGTSDYSFVWCMAGENYSFEDMDHVDMADLR